MEKQSKVSVIIPAAGFGKRMKSDVSKQYIEIEGKPILAFTIEKFQNAPSINEIILVVGDGESGYVEKYIKNRYEFTKVTQIIKGGKERQDSVQEGLNVLAKETDIVLVHDAVRPLISVEAIEKIISETKKYQACIFGVKVKDTIKVADEARNVSSTPDRSHLYAIQTPQAFERALICDAYKKGTLDGFRATDDSMLVEKYSDVKVRIVEGNYSNLKITTPEDLQMAKEWMTATSK